MAPFSVTDLQDSFEKLKKSLEWIRDLIRKRDWAGLLILAAAVLFLLVWTDPGAFLSSTRIERWTLRVVAGGTGVLLLLAALAMMLLRRTPSALPPAPPIEHTAIKGLRPFTSEDAELFSRLQREAILRECLGTLTDPSFRFGVLSGTSGCGKTSFLQAGLRPRLEKRHHRCVYVKFTDLDPVRAILLALIDCSMVPRSTAEETSLGALLTAAAQADPARPLVLVLDQFEQFFVHRAQRSAREPFVAAMADWYRGHAGLPVKILVCLRDDFMGRLSELHQAMAYSLGPSQNLRLEKFEPSQAAAVFRVIAESADIAVDATTPRAGWSWPPPRSPRRSSVTGARSPSSCRTTRCRAGRSWPWRRTRS
jgi:Novel STAND NTPase 1